MKTNILITAHSEKGTRERNEDFYSVQTNKNGQVLAIICDGIGGDEDSQIASKTVVLNFESLFKKKKKIINFVSFYNTVLKKTLKIINAKSKKNSKMGTTVCVVLITGNKAEMANIGDSRIYYFNNANKEWKQKSFDHNLYNFILLKFQNQREADPTMIDIIKEKQKKTLAENKDNLLSLTKCIETGSKISQDDSYYKVVENLSSDDLIYLCSDGVYNWIKLDKINAIIEQNSNYKIIANKVVNEAFTNKSNDNMTAIILKIK